SSLRVPDPGREGPSSRWGLRNRGELVSLLLLFSLLAGLILPVDAHAQARQRARIIWDVPQDRVLRIGRVASGFTLEVDVPFHTTGDVRSAEVTVWSRGVVAGLVG